MKSMTTITKEQAQRALNRTERELEHWQDAHSCALDMGLSEQAGYAASQMVYLLTIRAVLQAFLDPATPDWRKMFTDERMLVFQLREQIEALEAKLEKIEGLEAGIRIAEDNKHNSDWLLWCGDKHHAEAILEAAKRYAKLTEET